MMHCMQPVLLLKKVLFPVVVLLISALLKALEKLKELSGRVNQKGLDAL